VKATYVSKFEHQNPGLSVNVFGFSLALLSGSASCSEKRRQPRSARTCKCVACRRDREADTKGQPGALHSVSLRQTLAAECIAGLANIPARWLVSSATSEHQPPRSLRRSQAS